MSVTRVLRRAAWWARARLLPPLARPDFQRARADMERLLTELDRRGQGAAAQGLAAACGLAPEDAERALDLAHAQRLAARQGGAWRLTRRGRSLYGQTGLRPGAARETP